MRQLIKPRLIPLFGWIVIILLGLFCAYVLYARPAVSLVHSGASESPRAEKDSLDQALKNLAAIKASTWMHSEPGILDQSLETLALALAPERVAVPEAAANVAPTDPSLKGAVVVQSGRQVYLLLGGKRFRTGQRISTGETIRTLNLQTVELTSAEGRGRTVEIGRAIGPASQQNTTW